MRKQLFITFCISFIFLVQGCSFFTKKESVTPAEDLIQPSDSKSLGEALILPSGTTTVQGTPPSPSTSTQAPKATADAEKSTSNGSSDIVPIQYSNLNGGIGGVYFQVEGASIYYKTPINNSNPPKSGVINLPIGIPDNLASGTFYMSICIFDASGRVSNIIRIRIIVSRIETPKAGKGTAVVNGQTLSADAICNMDLGSGIRGYGILIGNSGMIYLYNLKQGNNTFPNVINGLNNGNFDIQSQVWAAYIDINTSDTYYSTAGSATYSGKIVKVSGTFESILTGKRVSVSATGNCQ